MRIVSIAARAFKGLDRIELADLAPDLNLVVGPNESGKSRLVTALRYALFERYKGESEDKKALRTYGSTEAPSVEVSFETRGTVYTVRKQFLKASHARLEGGGRTWTDDDAEGKLRELLGTRPISGRREIDQFLGLWPLLWVRQGEGGFAPQSHMNEDARARLRDVLAAQVNQVAAGPLGERLVARAERERDRYFTAAAWKETGELSLARMRHAEAEQALAQATAKRAEAHGAADELAALLGELARIDARIAPQRQRVAEAAARAARARDIAAKLREHEATAGRRRVEAELAERTLAERAEAARRRADAARKADEERAALGALAGARVDLARRGDEAAARAERAHLDLEAAHAAHLRARRRVHHDDAARREQGARERLARARGHEARVAELRGQLAAAGIDEVQIQRLRRANDVLSKAGAALAAASATVRFQAARDLVVSGAKLAEGEERRWTCDAPARIVIDGVGAFEVRPGGVDLEARRAKEQEARHAMQGELARLGAADLAQAEERFARRTGLAAQLAQAEPLLAEAAPEGVGALEEEVRARAIERAALAESEESAREEGSIEQAEVRLAEATAAVMGARGERDALRAEAARAAEESARRERGAAELAREAAEATARLEGLASEEALGAALAAARAALVEARTLADALSDEVSRAGEADARLAHEQEARALDRLDAERATKHARRLHLEALVRVYGADDLHERVQRAEADLDERAASLRALEARAAAARELVLALHTARREVQERLVAPVIDRARPYLEALLPGRRLRLDANWGVSGLVSGDIDEDFDSLSGGAKEQVSILVRLALAEVLGEKEPLPVVLDDCLVNTDRARLGEMLRILYRAAKKQQILVLSCHDLELDRLGETKRYELGKR
jgi:energy-coupling factor transporter ATP-binding protein EcfA2